MTGTLHVLRQIAAETPEQIQAARAAFYQERAMRQIPIRTPQQARIAAMLGTCPAPKPTPDEWAIAGEGSYIAQPDPGEAPMAVDVPQTDDRFQRPYLPYDNQTRKRIDVVVLLGSAAFSLAMILYVAAKSWGWV